MGTWIKIPHKKSASNKTNTVGEKAPTPFIDKLSIVLDIEGDAEAADVYASLFTAVQDKALFKQAPGVKWGKFKFATRVALGSIQDQEKWPLLHCAYDKPAKGEGKATVLRLEFVPVDLGKKGLIELHAVLKLLLDDGWGAFVKRGRVTRLDIAVDLQGVAVGDFRLLPSIGSTSRQWRRDGTLETFTQGKPKGNHTAVYDRAAKRKAQGKAWQGKTGVRVERRLKMMPKLLILKDLASMTNPYLGFDLVEVDTAPEAEGKPYIWELFKDAAAVRGLSAALALLPEDKRAIYRKHLSETPKKWWDAQGIWMNWPAMLDDTKIATPSAWF